MKKLFILLFVITSLSLRESIHELSFKKKPTFATSEEKILLKSQRQGQEKRSQKGESLSAFQQLTSKTNAEIPKVSEMKKISHQELHHFGKKLIPVGINLAKIKAKSLSDERLLSYGKKFFKECLNSKEIPASVRSLCLANLIELKNEQLSFEEAELLTTNQQVIRLALSLNDF